MLHHELGDGLRAAVCTSLNPSIGMSAKESMKFKKSCQDWGLVHLLDFTIAPPFHHLIYLSLEDGLHFYPSKRGKALAGAGRSAAPSPPSSTGWREPRYPPPDPRRPVA
jgi:hypothetical protein